MALSLKPNKHSKLILHKKQKKNIFFEELIKIEFMLQQKKLQNGNPLTQLINVIKTLL